jgi:hypothetical protein
MPSLGIAWQWIPTVSSASVFHGSGPRWLAPVSQITLQSSLKGYSSLPYGSQTALPNRQHETVLLCPWPPSQGPGPQNSDLTHSLTHSRTTQRNHFQQLPYCCLSSQLLQSCDAYQPLHSNGTLLHSVIPCLQYCNLATAVSLAPLFHLSGAISH